MCCLVLVTLSLVKSYIVTLSLDLFQQKIALGFKEIAIYRINLKLSGKYDLDLKIENARLDWFRSSRIRQVGLLGEVSRRSFSTLLSPCSDDLSL